MNNKIDNIKSNRIVTDPINATYQLGLFQEYPNDEKLTIKEDEPSGLTSTKSGTNNLIRVAYDDFILSRQGMNCTPRTIGLYKFILGKVLDWLDRHAVTNPIDLTGYHIRSLLGEMAGKGYSDSYMHIYAREIKTFVKFLFNENYIQKPIVFEMPKVVRKRLLTYNENEIRTILNACKDKRDTAFILLMVDSGLRKAEVLSLNWGDVDLSSGIVRVEKGKGRKPRSVIVGPKTRRELLKYRSTIDGQESKPLFQTKQGNRFSEAGLRSWLLRLSKRAGIHITPHALRRTFATMSVRAGMNLFELQGLMGHSSLDMTRQYVTMLEEDLVNAHAKHGPIDFIFK